MGASAFEAVVDDYGARKGDSFHDMLGNGDVGGGTFGESVPRYLEERFYAGAGARRSPPSGQLSRSGAAQMHGGRGE